MFLKFLIYSLKIIFAVCRTLLAEFIFPSSVKCVITFFMVSNEKYVDFQILFSVLCYVSFFFDDFKDFFFMSGMQWLPYAVSICDFILITSCFGFVELLKLVYLCFSQNMGNFQPLFLQSFLMPYSFAHFHCKSTIFSHSN